MCIFASLLPLPETEVGICWDMYHGLLFSCKYWCHQTEYLGLADQLSDYVVKLLDKVRGHDELEKLINKKRRDPTDESYALLARLQMAIQCNEKKVGPNKCSKWEKFNRKLWLLFVKVLSALFFNLKFVAHPSCQQKLVSIWYDDFRIIERSHWMVRIFIVLGISMMFPFLSVFYWLAPSTKVCSCLYSQQYQQHLVTI